MISPTLVSFVSALTALIATIAGPFVTLYVARTQFKATEILSAAKSGC